MTSDLGELVTNFKHWEKHREQEREHFNLGCDHVRKASNLGQTITMNENSSNQCNRGKRPNRNQYEISKNKKNQTRHTGQSSQNLAAAQYPGICFPDRNQ